MLYQISHGSSSEGIRDLFQAFPYARLWPIAMTGQGPCKTPFDCSDASCCPPASDDCSYARRRSRQQSALAIRSREHGRVQVCMPGLRLCRLPQQRHDSSACPHPHSL